MTDTPGSPARPGLLRVKLAQKTAVPLDAAFDVAPGEVVALLGASGSGKTTMLKAIAGLVTPQLGRVSLGDDVWFDSAQAINRRPEARRVGFVFQDYALFPHLSVRNNVAIAMRHVAAVERAERADGLLRQIGIEPLGDRFPRQLSGGERQRVALARALAREPSVLLLDEPFSAVDRPARERLKREIQAVAATIGVPVILVTHDIDEAVALARRLVIIDRGTMIADGLAAELMAAPQGSRVSDIIGTNPLPLATT